jgi:hypothetical protein
MTTSTASVIAIIAFLNIACDPPEQKICRPRREQRIETTDGSPNSQRESLWREGAWRLAGAYSRGPSSGRVRAASSNHAQSRTQDGDQQRDDDYDSEYEDEFAVAALSLHPLSVTSGIAHSG